MTVISEKRDISIVVYMIDNNYESTNINYIY